MLAFDLGFSIGALPNKLSLIIGSSIAILVFLCSIVLLGWSGLICVVTSLPLILFLKFTGSVVMFFIQKVKKVKGDRLTVLFLPLFIFLIGAAIEQLLTVEKESVIHVKTEMMLDYTPIQVYDAIK